MTTDEITCIHAKSGLCAQCQADYDESPSDYIEFGDHPAGIANWRALQEEMAAEAAAGDLPTHGTIDDEIPF